MLATKIKMPVQQRSIERLEKVIQTTVTLLETEPLEQCQIQTISTISGVPRNFIYQYFPTIDHLYSLIVSRYFEKLPAFLLLSQQAYQVFSLLQIIEDVLARACEFYNQNKTASVLILGGPVTIDGFSLQQMVIEQIARDFLNLIEKINIDFELKKADDMVILVELIFALMTHSYYRYGTVTKDIQSEIMGVCEVYLAKKGYLAEIANFFV